MAFDLAIHPVGQFCRLASNNLSTNQSLGRFAQFLGDVATEMADPVDLKPLQIEFRPIDNRCDDQRGRDFGRIEVETDRGVHFHLQPGASIDVEAVQLHVVVPPRLAGKKLHVGQYRQTHLEAVVRQPAKIGELHLEPFVGIEQLDSVPAPPPMPRFFPAALGFELPAVAAKLDSRVDLLREFPLFVVFVALWDVLADQFGDEPQQVVRRWSGNDGAAQYSPAQNRSTVRSSLAIRLARTRPTGRSNPAPMRIGWTRIGRSSVELLGGVQLQGRT